MPTDTVEQERDNQPDFDSRADKLWSIYNKEAESHDRALMETWKDDMDSIIIFAGLFSAVLTAFLVDASKRLKEDPTDQTNALLTQTVVLLAQISQQLGPNGSQIIVSLPQPLEPPKLNPSDFWVNIFWYMSLGFSIIAALGATLVQQWVRDYLQVFQRLSGSLERSRMRQFLFHGMASNYMPLVVECIPAFIHVSLFLFFIGLAENLFAVNGVIAITTTTVIGFCLLFYVACSVLPVLYPQTPFHTPLSNVFWRLAQIIYPHKHSDRNAGGKIVPVSSDMAKGRLQLAMGHSHDRMALDTEAIHWILTKITEDSEFEPFVAGIGGSLATPWGRDIWERVLLGDMHPQPVSSIVIVPNTVQMLKIRLESLLRSCAVSTFSDQQTRFMRACVCIDAVASLTLCFHAELELGIDDDLMNQALRYFSAEKKKQDKLVQGPETSSGLAMNLRQLPDNQAMDSSLEIKWKCLVLIGMKKALQPGSWVALLAKFYGKCVYSKAYRVYEDEAITSRALEVDFELLKAWNAARQFYSELREIPEELLTENRLNELIPHWRGHIEAMQESLYALNLLVDPSIDLAAGVLNQHFSWITGGAGIFCEIEWPSPMNPVAFTFEGIKLELDPHDPSIKRLMPHLVPPRVLICRLLVCADPRRRHNFDPSTSRIDLVGMSRLLNNPEMQRLFEPQRVDKDGHGIQLEGPQPYVNQFWRFKDISEHRGAGFMIEMFFAAFRSLERKSVTFESKQLITATLRAITDNGQSEHFKTVMASRRFLWALRQELEKVIGGGQLAGGVGTPPLFIVELLWNLFGRWV